MARNLIIALVAAMALAGCVDGSSDTPSKTWKERLDSGKRLWRIDAYPDPSNRCRLILLDPYYELNLAVQIENCTQTTRP